MFSLLRTKVTDAAVKRYIDTGKVSDSVIRRIAFAFVEGRDLTDNEKVIFYGETARVSELIIELAKLKKDA